MRNASKLKYAFPMALAAMAVTGCSHEASDMPDPSSPETGAIRFAPKTSYTRAEDITASNLKSFNVYAYTEGADDKLTLFMDNVTVNRTDNNTWVYSPLQFWPSEAVDFYAYAPSGTWAGAHGPFEAGTSYMSYPGDKDLVYAVSLGNRGTAQGENAQVILNFRHALSKVAFRLSSSNANLEVKVTNVVLFNVYANGTFRYPTATTSASATPDAASVCTWEDTNTQSAYIYYMAQRDNERVSLTTTPTDFSTESPDTGGAKYLIPQALPYDLGDDHRDVYVSITCAIYDKDTGVQLWPNDNTPEANKLPQASFNEGLLRFPLHTNQFTSWEPGKYYIYNIVINANPDMGHINFGMPTVDQYVTVETTYE